MIVRRSLRSIYKEEREKISICENKEEERDEIVNGSFVEIVKE
jgi:hypothetical protein